MVGFIISCTLTRKDASSIHLHDTNQAAAYVILCHALLSLVLKCACAILYHWFVFWQDAISYFVISREKRDNFILIKEISKSKIHMEKFIIVFYNKVKLI